ncbi:ATP-binding cassette domain-containing protein [Flavobacterium sp. YO12]|uniref:ATP-binding cassette domain-containing protein n=1 Tax=Flavobacterium sp. YO12 TaxID=1920029 RepID=UPI00100BB8D9|nr:ATP-binding cassette domain-containing protein [Flavobacterium sp. YO12]RXM42056.1 ABC transporter [Flavobacterium sp. YO12]
MKQRDIVGFLVEMVAGKTTLLKIIFGIEQADYKHLKINEKIYNNAYLIKECIGYLPQFSFVPKYFTVKKIAKIFLKIDEDNSFFNDKNIFKILNTKVKNLSCGELRYLEIKLILSQEKKFVILDEPFSGLSPIIIEDVKQLIIKASETTGIIITDHNYFDVLDICTKKYLIRDCSCMLISSEEDLKKNGYL